MSEKQRVNFAPTFDPWNGVQLQDGTFLRLRLVVRNVHRVVGAFNADGSPKYDVDWTVLVNVDAPPQLMKDYVPPSTTMAEAAN